MTSSVEVAPCSGEERTGSLPTRWGVVFSEDDDERCVQQVLEAAAADVQALEAASGRVLGVEVGDDVTRRRASRVLEKAALYCATCEYGVRTRGAPRCSCHPKAPATKPSSPCARGSSSPLPRPIPGRLEVRSGLPERSDPAGQASKGCPDGLTAEQL